MRKLMSLIVVSVLFVGCLNNDDTKPPLTTSIDEQFGTATLELLGTHYSPSVPIPCELTISRIGSEARLPKSVEFELRDANSKMVWFASRFDIHWAESGSKRTFKVDSIYPADLKSFNSEYSGAKTGAFELVTKLNVEGSPEVVLDPLTIRIEQTRRH